MIKNSTLIILLSTIILSCSNQITGLYYNKDFNRYTPDVCYISICEDSVFYYAHNDIIGEADYSGTWSLNVDTLLFDINKPCITKTNNQIEICQGQTSLKKIELKIIRSCGDTIPGFFHELLINHTHRIRADSIGIATIQIDSIFVIQIDHYFNTIPNTSFSIVNPSFDYFKLFAGESDAVQFASYSLIHNKFLYQKRTIYPILENFTQDYNIFDFGYKRHKKCTRK